MPRPKKQEVVAPVNPPAEAPKAKKSKKEKKKSKKSKAPVVEATPQPVEAVESPPVEAPVSTETENTLEASHQKTDETLKGLIASVQERIASDKALLSSLRELSRRLVRERKETERTLKKLRKGQRKKRAGNKSPGGFTKPAPLSPQMCTFLGVDKGTELPRTEVTRRVNAYVKEHKLQNPENKKEILADNKLKKLLFLKNGDELTYFNLQRYMKVHFLKKDKETGNVLPFQAPA
jgi:upstream activation factor subunit UAF30